MQWVPTFVCRCTNVRTTAVWAMELLHYFFGIGFLMPLLQHVGCCPSNLYSNGFILCRNSTVEHASITFLNNMFPITSFRNQLASQFEQ